MIPNIWNKIRLVCLNHDEPVKMSAHAAAGGSVAASLYGTSLNMFYSCPKYYPENRIEGEKLCRNHISINEYEGAVKKISAEIEEAMENGEEGNLEGFSWKSRQGIQYKVVKQTEDEIVIGCLNKKAIRF